MGEKNKKFLRFFSVEDFRLKNGLKRNATKPIFCFDDRSDVPEFGNVRGFRFGADADGAVDALGVGRRPTQGHPSVPEPNSNSQQCPGGQESGSAELRRPGFVSRLVGRVSRSAAGSETFRLLLPAEAAASETPDAGVAPPQVLVLAESKVRRRRPIRGQFFKR